LVALGVESIRVVPVFLGQGGHVRRDLPGLIAGVQGRFAGITISVAAPAGEDGGVLDALARYCVGRRGDWSYRGKAMREPLSADLLRRIDAYWRAANYLSVGQIYLLDNPLLREPLRLEHVKARLLRHWCTTPGLNFVYAHVNRAIVEHDLDALFIAGPGH